MTIENDSQYYYVILFLLIVRYKTRVRFSPQSTSKYYNHVTLDASLLYSLYIIMQSHLNRKLKKNANEINKMFLYAIDEKV